MKRKRTYSPNFILGLVITGVMLLLILIGFIHTPYDIMKMDSAAKLAAPSLAHPMGCDNFARVSFRGCSRGWATRL